MSFKNEHLAYTDFSGSDLRGLDFTGSDLTGADLRNIRTGINPLNTVLIFAVTLIISAISGYIAMLAGQTMQRMLDSDERNLKIAGIAAVTVVIIFILFSWWKGVETAVRRLILPIAIIAIIIGVVGYTSGAGNGRGVLYLILSLALVVTMFVVGTVARAAAGSLSNIIFVFVAMGGAFFGRTVGGGLGTVIMAVGCMLVSKRALSGAKGFHGLKKIVFYVTSRFGTSFRNTNLTGTDFSGANLHNSDFSDAETVQTKWGDAKMKNCIIK